MKKRILTCFVLSLPRTYFSQSSFLYFGTSKIISFKVFENKVSEILNIWPHHDSEMRKLAHALPNIETF